jgi:hypothetical protein
VGVIKIVGAGVGWGGILYRHMKHVHNTRVQKHLYSCYFTKRVTAVTKAFGAKSEFESNVLV